MEEFYKAVGIIVCFAIGYSAIVAGLAGLIIGASEVFSLFMKLIKHDSFENRG